MRNQIIAMRIFVYEFVTGGGFLDGARGAPPDSLLREGTAMVSALAADFVAAGAEVHVLKDFRRGRWNIPGVVATEVRSPEEERDCFLQCAARCDATVVIAPETAGMLTQRCRWVESVDGRLLGPSSRLAELASDKHATAQWLRSAGVSVPDGWAVEPGGSLSAEAVFPAVGKPRWGAGSCDVQLLADARAAHQWLSSIFEPSRVERFAAGLAASVAVLCGPAGVFPLPPCRQRLTSDGRFEYRGGSLPLDAAFANRAAAVATRAVEALPSPHGYLGVDLVLGDDREGRGDTVIEINPRLTTSYVGLRAAAAPDTNLAAAMLAVCEGHTPQLCFRPIAVEFEPNGTVMICQMSPKSQPRSMATTNH